MDGFEPVGFTLAVVTVDDVESRSPKDFAAQISKIIYFERLEDHRRDFSINPSSRARNQKIGARAVLRPAVQSSAFRLSLASQKHKLPGPLQERR